MERKLRTHQSQAVEAIKEALNRGQRRVVVEMPVGCGLSRVLVKTAEILDGLKVGKTLVVTSRAEIKELVKKELFANNQEMVQIDKRNIVVETEYKILNQINEIKGEYSVVIFFDAATREGVYKQIEGVGKTTIVFSTIKKKASKRLFPSKDIVFTYSYKEAIKEGYITPAMNIGVFIVQ